LGGGARRDEWDRRSNCGERRRIPKDVDVVLLDSIGELASLYRVADGAFVGGSLVPSGGHNILEPAAFGKIPVLGHRWRILRTWAADSWRMERRFRWRIQKMPEARGHELLRAPERRTKMKLRLLTNVEENRGATGTGGG